jgi:hypothetical protein
MINKFTKEILIKTAYRYYDLPIKRKFNYDDEVDYLEVLKEIKERSKNYCPKVTELVL